MAADAEPHHSSFSGGSASCSGGGGGGSSSSSPSHSSPSPPPAPLAPPLFLPPLASVASPHPSCFQTSIAAVSQQQQQTSIAAVSQQQQQLLQQQYHHQLHQQRLLSFHLPSAAAASSHAPTSTPLKPPLPVPPLSSAPPTSASVPGSGTPTERHLRDDCWSEGATITLINAWGERYLELNRGNLKQKHWSDVADCVSRRGDGSKSQKTDIQCKNRIDTLKKKYKLEKAKVAVGGGSSKWPFFTGLDELLGPSKKTKKPIPLKLRHSVPLSPSSPVLALPAKRPLEGADQHPQSLPLSGAPNYSASAASNHATPTHVESLDVSHSLNHINLLNCAPNHSGIALNQVNNTTNHLSSAPNNGCSVPNQAACAGDAASKSKESLHTVDSCHDGEIGQPKRLKRKRPYIDPMQELAQAIVKFGEAYERIEITRQKTLSEIEKQRMIFLKDLELQRLQFFMQMQVELAKLRQNSKHENPDDCA
ncbi:hypothetical protein KP509_10G060000 [Ceratopteris richardii]|uniref:Myb/SANT-like DNA-binding domain-containing protein n=1 Tax=Ceratopteris richardii TaxID=49495 RepID=A0A8T2TWC1_CERRI|nr:hypothetical protein KP509_10G060000 [Ceratopteris richardii]